MEKVSGKRMVLSYAPSAMMKHFFLVLISCAAMGFMQAETLFDGKTLQGWRTTDFAGHGEVAIEGTNLVIHTGASLSGVTWTNNFPTNNFEVTVEAKKAQGSDFFAAMTFPAGGGHATFVAGGWGGGVVGISSVDGQDASENETVKYRKFELNRWYQFKVRVTSEKIEAWIDDDAVVNLEIKGRRISLRHGEIDLNMPFGLATYQTTGVIRKIELRRLDASGAKPARREP